MDEGGAETPPTPPVTLGLNEEVGLVSILFSYPLPRVLPASDFADLLEDLLARVCPALDKDDLLGLLFAIFHLLECTKDPRSSSGPSTSLASEEVSDLGQGNTTKRLDILNMFLNNL